MLAFLSDLLELSFTGPVWPASVLLCLVLVYSVLVLFGLVDADFDGPDIDADGIADMSESALSVGAATVRWFNIDSVPVFVWTGVFSIIWWILTLVLWQEYDSDHYTVSVLSSALLAARNFVVAALCTKFATAPMRRWFEKSPAYKPGDIVGNECEIETGQADTEFGRARFETDGAPLLLNIRTSGETLTRGQRAEIIDFDPTTRIYTVQSIEERP